jgi:archaellum component FlaF (FlaF/FlaG flagellin family)
MASKVNIVIDQGTTFNTTYTINDAQGEPIDFTGYTASSQIRKTYTSSTAYDFTVTMTSLGQVTLSMTADSTGIITAGRYVYDIEVQDLSGIRSRIVEGLVTVTPQVSR